jgi:hypothetical protein
VLLPDPAQLLTEDDIRQHVSARGFVPGPIVCDAGKTWLVQLPSQKTAAAVSFSVNCVIQ